jgi:abortive infection bacteriophage resistance protein
MIKKDPHKQLYKSPSELVVLLKERNLKFRDEKKAKTILQENSYFSLIPYKDLFLANSIGTYKENVDFLDIYRFYVFDKDFKTHLLRELLEIESKIKSAIAEVISFRYGTAEKDYLNPSNFDQRSPYVAQTILKIKKQKALYGKKSERLRYYQRKHYGRCPFWVLSHVITIGALRDFYLILKPNDSDAVARTVFSRPIKHPSRRLGTIIAFLADVRNMCAHDEPMVGFVHKRLDIGPFPEHEKLHILKTKEGNPLGGRKDVLAVLLSIKYLVSKADFHKFMCIIVSDVNGLCKDLSNCSKKDILSAIGLCDNYQSLDQQ